MNIKAIKLSTEVVEEVQDVLEEHCIKRNYHCKGCSFNIRKWIPDYEGPLCCIFGNCPSTWTIMTKEDYNE